MEKKGASTWELNHKLLNLAVKALEAEGCSVTRIPATGKSSLRRITKDGKSEDVSIRTTRDGWVSFQRGKAGWVTLPDAKWVIAASIDPDDPKLVNVHRIEGADMLDRFDRTYAARVAAGYVIRPGHGVWSPLYKPESQVHPYFVGAGAGLVNKPIWTGPLDDGNGGTPSFTAIAPPKTPHTGPERPLSIPEAKRLLALSLGVPEANIRISVEA